MARCAPIAPRWACDAALCPVQRESIGVIGAQRESTPSATSSSRSWRHRAPISCTAMGIARAEPLGAGSAGRLTKRHRGLRLLRLQLPCARLALDYACPRAASSIR